MEASRRDNSMFRTRLLSGILLVIIVAGTIWGGGVWLFLPLLAISLIGMKELNNALSMNEKEKDKESSAMPLEAAGYAGAVFVYAAAWLSFDQYGMMAVTMTLVLILFVYVFGYPRFTAGQVMGEFFSVIYVAVMLSFLYSTRCLPDGRGLAALIFLCSWGCDTCAYVVGKLFGKHKMTPVLSPKKSIEGAVGGVAGAALLGAGFARLTGAPWWAYALICAVGALVSMVGDLAASAIKRNTGIKDYGHLIPGHGGILDRFDSVIMTAPMIYYLAKLLMR